MVHCSCKEWGRYISNCDKLVAVGLHFGDRCEDALTVVFAREWVRPFVQHTGTPAIPAIGFVGNSVPVGEERYQFQDTI